MLSAAQALARLREGNARFVSNRSAGLSHPAHDFKVKHVSIVAEERTIKGSYIGSAVPARDVPRYIDLFMQGRLPVDRLLSAKLPLSQINAALDTLAAGHVARQVLEP